MFSGCKFSVYIVSEKEFSCNLKWTLLPLKEYITKTYLNWKAVWQMLDRFYEMGHWEKHSTWCQELCLATVTHSTGISLCTMAWPSIKYVCTLKPSLFFFPFFLVFYFFPRTTILTANFILWFEKALMCSKFRNSIHFPQGTFTFTVNISRVVKCSKSRSYKKVMKKLVWLRFFLSIHMLIACVCSKVDIQLHTSVITMKIDNEGRL